MSLAKCSARSSTFAQFWPRTFTAASSINASSTESLISAVSATYLAKLNPEQRRAVEHGLGPQADGRASPLLSFDVLGTLNKG
jgi:hypothetical protein